MPQDATGTWNRFATGYSFLETTDQGVGNRTTFGGAYGGDDFTADFNGILGAVDEMLRPNAAAPPAFGSDDLMLEHLENYPDNPGPSQ